MCVRWRNAAARCWTLQCVNVCPEARGQGGLLAALMAFHPPQVSRKTYKMLAWPLQTASSRCRMSTLNNITKYGLFSRWWTYFLCPGESTISSMRKLPACLLCSVEAKVRHLIFWGVKRLRITCNQTDEICKPALLMLPKAGAWTLSESLCTSFAHEQWWKKGQEPADQRVPLCHHCLMLHCLLVIALSSCSGCTDG